MRTLEIWTDGGKNKELCSWAFCIYSPDLDKVIHHDYGHLEGTSQEGELSAAIEALKFTLKRFDKSLNKIDIVLYSDSQYLVKGLNAWLWGWKNRGWKGSSMKTIKNLDYWKTLDKLKSSFPSVQFKWVKGHAGIELNEYVDGLCTQALKEARNNKIST